MNNSFNLCMDEYKSYIEDYLSEQCFQFLNEPQQVLFDAMRYSLLAGGKRLRPIFVFDFCRMCGGDWKAAVPFAAAVEMIHTYSLIHDDLPSMDNDDFRRGKPTTHKVYGEAMAILAGDALLNEAYAICFAQCMKGEKYALASSFLNECAGMYGMIVGQSADLYFSEQDGDVSVEDLFYIYEHKTGKLLLAPVAIASILSGNKFYLAFENFGKLLGRLFQMTDDILDVTGDFTSLGKSIGKECFV